MENDIDTDDDEIVLEGSPLYEYLKKACPNDGFHSFQSTADTDDATSLVGKDSNSLTKRIQDAGKLVQHWTTKLSHGVQFPVNRKELLAYLNNQALPKYYSHAIRSRRMNEDDAAILSTLLGVPGKPTKLSRTKITIWLFILCLLMLGHVLLLYGVCHPIFLWDTLEDINIPSIIVYIVVMVTLLLSLMWQVSVLWQYYRSWTEHHHQEQSVSQFLSVHSLFGDFLKKAVLYVQEVEVILRGYTMMTPFTPISHLERGSQTQLQCPALRQAIFQAARNQFLSLRQAMLSTLASTPLSDEEQRDLDDLYLATTDLQHLAGELSILTDDSTGPYPTSHLKAFSNLYSDQLSEFLRRHLLCLKSDLLADSAGVTSSWHLTLDNNLILAERDLTTLRSSYKLHQPMTPPQSDIDPEVKLRGTQEIWGPSDILPSATRALRLHLDVTMKCAMQLERKTPKEDGKLELENSEVHDLEELLAEVKGHLEACQTCVHEAETALTKLTGRVEPTKLKKAGISPSVSEPLKANVAPPQHLDFISPKDSDIDFIEEEVFEAYIDPERDDTIPDYSMEDLTEDRRKKKQDSEDAKHMLLELHSVLSKREEEKEKMRRERRRIKEGGDSVIDGEMLDGLNEGEEDEEKEGGGEKNIRDACGDSTNKIEREHSPSVCDGISVTDLNQKQTTSLEHHEYYEKHIGKVNDQHLSNPTNLSKDSSAETRPLEVSDFGDIERLKCGDDKVLSNQMSLYGCHEVGTASIDEGYDASGIGKSTETLIRRPVPKPRKNVGKRLYPAREGNVDSLVSDSNLVSHDNGEGSGQNSRDLEENKILDPDEEHCSEDEDGDGRYHWRQQSMAIPFMQGLAAEAVRISRERQSLAEDTFGD